MITKKKRISEFKENDKVDDIFVVKFKKGLKPYAKGHCFELTLSDSSFKNIELKYWGGKEENKVKNLYESIKPDSIIHVKGSVSSYNSKLQISVNEDLGIKVLEEGEYDKTEFIKHTEKNIEEMYSELLKAAESVENPEIRKLLEKVFKDQEIMEKFKKSPGAIEIHHNWTGGLLEHTLEVLNYCRTTCENFRQIDKDLLIAGALLHDIGKLEELTTTTRIKGTKKGQLSGHLTLSALLVSKKCDETGITGDLRDKILHIIISHHGKAEFGSPKEPMFPEAVAVHYADELSSKMSEMIEFIKNAREDTEDDFMYHKRHNRNILLK